MNKTMRYLILVGLAGLCLLICIASIAGQERTTATASPLPPPELATVYVYRRDEGGVVTSLFLPFKKTRAVYFSERLGGIKRKNRKIAALRNRQYFMMRLPPGKYIFDTAGMWKHLELDVVENGKYYLWVDQGCDCGYEDSTEDDRNAEIVSVSAERWGWAIPSLQPIKNGDVKDRRVVIV